MKKIIYSLVIMIAAGSLFTSCVTNTEPQGIKDIREAKANYLDALANLRAADAAVRNADAEYRKAETALKQAEAALKQAAVEAAEIAIKVEDAAAQALIAKIKSDAEVAALEAQKNLAKKQLELEQALRDLAANSKELTTEEKNVISRYTDAYSKYIEAVEKVSKKEVALYDATYKQDTCTTVEVAKAEYEQEKADAELQKAIFEAELAVAEELSEAQIADYEEWVAKYDALVAENEGFKYDSAEIHKAIALNEYENKDAIDSFTTAVIAAETKVNSKKKPFDFKEYKTNLPEVSLKGFSSNPVVSVVDNFAAAADTISLVTIGKDNKDNKTITVAASQNKSVVGDVVDSLNLIIEALNREKVVVDQIVKDTTGIAALVAKTNAEYKAVKDTLSDGIDAWQGIKAAKEAQKKAEGKPAEARAKYTQDTAALFESISDFIDVWNGVAEFTADGTIQGTHNVFGQKYNDSALIFNALKNIMEQRENVFKKDAKFGYYQHKGTKITTDTVLFSDIKFEDLRDGVYDLTSTGAAENGFLRLLNEAFGTESLFNSKMTKSGGKLQIQHIDVPYIKGSYNPGTHVARGTMLFQNLFFGEWWVAGSANEAYGEIYAKGGTSAKYATKYCEKAVNDSTSAAELVRKARRDYYQKFYCTYWGIKDTTTLANNTSFDLQSVKFTDKADSLCVDAFDEKTFTDPYVLVKFSAKKGTTIFTASEKSSVAAVMNWKNVEYNDTLLGLQVIKKQKGGVDYIFPKHSVNDFGATDYTLYAKTLAVAQFADAAVNYKENTQALKELTEIVAAIETKFKDAKKAETEGTDESKALAEAFLGKGFSVYAKDINAVNGAIKADGSFNFGGEQKKLAEKWLTDYAKTYAEIVKEGKTIDAKAKANRNLAKIYADYIAELADLQGLTQTAPDSVYQEIKEAWYGKDVLSVNADGNVEVVHINGVLDDLQDCIDVWAKEIKKAEAKIAKLEAGYDQSQIDIEEAQNDLAEAQEELEAAEAKLAAAKAAYEQVLANHGLAE